MSTTRGLEYIDALLIPEEHLPEPTETSIPERELWCHVVKRVHEDILTVMSRCEKGVQKLHMYGHFIWTFDERARLSKYILSDDFEEICGRANVSYQLFANKFKELLQLKV